jgi:hypothetical protein
MRDVHLDRLVDAAVAIYAPLPAASPSMVIARLRSAAPQWRRRLKDALERALAAEHGHQPVVESLQCLVSQLLGGANKMS